MATEKTDVVIIGVGAAGGILAAELGKAGMKVIGLERGPRLTTQDFNPHDELRYFQRQDLRPNIKRQPVTWRPNKDARANPMPVLNNGNQAGGGTVHYGAVSWRMHEDDFRARSHTTERYGASAIPADSSLADWPLSYADLEPYYDRAEYELGVSGKAGNLQGRKIDGGNVFEAPRRREYPLPPLLQDQAEILFDAAGRKLGYHPFSTPRAIISQPYQGRPGCTYCGFCQSFGCHVGAKSSILVTKLPEADATGNFKLLTGATCYRINSDNSGRVTGVSYWGPDGMMANVFVGFDDRHLNVYMGPSAQKHTLDDFNADNFDHKDLGFIRGSQISIGTGNLQGGPIALTTTATPPGVPRWGAAYRDFLATYFSRHAVMVAQTENLPYADQMIDLDPNVRDAWGLPAPRVTYDWRRPNERARVEFMQKKMEEIGRAMSAHQVWRAPVSPAGAPGAHHEGGTRMGSDPKTSVVNRYGQSWDIPNLFVIGSSTFPSMSGFNPTLTIQALAYMSADAIANRYKKSPGPLL